jgi:hypothetical protein
LIFAAKKFVDIDAKLEKLCYGYHRMEAIFGGRENVNPTNVQQSSLPTEDDSESSADDSQSVSSVSNEEVTNNVDVDDEDLIVTKKIKVGKDDARTADYYKETKHSEDEEQFISSDDEFDEVVELHKKRKAVMKTPAKAKANVKKLPDDLIFAAKKFVDSGSTSSSQSKSKSFGDTYATMKASEIEYKKGAHMDE